MDSMPTSNDASSDLARNPLAQSQLIDFWMAWALIPPLLVRLFQDGVSAAQHRLTVLASAFVVA